MISFPEKMNATVFLITFFNPGIAKETSSITTKNLEIRTTSEESLEPERTYLLQLARNALVFDVIVSPDFRLVFWGNTPLETSF